MGLHGEYFSSRGFCRYHGNLTVPIYQHAQNIILHTKVVGDDLEAVIRFNLISRLEIPNASLPGIAIFNADLSSQVHPLQAREFLSQTQCLCLATCF